MTKKITIALLLTLLFSVTASAELKIKKHFAIETSLNVNGKVSKGYLLVMQTELNGRQGVVLAATDNKKNPIDSIHVNYTTKQKIIKLLSEARNRRFKEIKQVGSHVENRLLSAITVGAGITSGSYYCMILFRKILSRREAKTTVTAVFSYKKLRAIIHGLKNKI